MNRERRIGPMMLKCPKCGAPRGREAMTPAAACDACGLVFAKWAARGKGYLVLIRPVAKGLIMQTLHYADEVRQIDEVPLGDAQIKDPELKLAVQLVDQISSEEFRPENYEDEVRKRYHEAIQRKVDGQEIAVQGRGSGTEAIMILMAKQHGIEVTAINRAARSNARLCLGDSAGRRLSAGNNTLENCCVSRVIEWREILKAK